MKLFLKFTQLPIEFDSLSDLLVQYSENLEAKISKEWGAKLLPNFDPEGDGWPTKLVAV